METAAQFLPLLVIGMVVAGLAWWASRRSVRPHQGVLTGFGGWLLLLAIGQTLAPFKQLMNLLQSFNTSSALFNVPNGKEVIYAEFLLNSALIAFTLCITVVMWRKFANFPRLFTLQWLIALAVTILEPAIVFVVLGLPISALAEVIPELISPLIQILAAGIWVWYVQKSVRVRNTFTRGSSRPSREAELTATL